MAGGELRGRGVGSPIVHSSLHIVGTGLGNSRSSHVLLALVDRVLHLLQELINVEQIALAPHIRHRGQVVCGGLAAARAESTAATNSNGGRHRLIFGHRTIQDGKLKRLESYETLADGGIGVRVKLAPLQIAEELVQRIVTALAIIRGIAVLALAQGVVYVAIRMGVSGWMLRMRLIIVRRAVWIWLVRHGVDGSFEVVMSSRSVA
jgi:hypothetical protein